MGFKDKLKNSLESVSDKLQTMNSSLTKVIKSVKDSSKSHEKLSEDKLEEATALTILMEESSDKYKEITKPFNEIFAKIESKRLEMTQELNTQFVQPLEGLVQDWLLLQDVIKEEEKAQKNHLKAKNTLDKKHQKFDKTPDKMKPGEIDDAATEVANCFDHLKAKQDEKAKMAAEYEQKKSMILTEALSNSIKIQGKFHQNVVDSLVDANDILETLHS